MKKIFSVIGITLLFLSEQGLTDEETNTGAVVGVILTVLDEQAIDDEEIIDEEELKIGEAIYQRAFGRGCGACHDIASLPQLRELIKADKLDFVDFSSTMINGKNGMPKSVAAIMAIGPVQEAGYTEDQAITAVYKFLSQ